MGKPGTIILCGKNQGNYFNLLGKPRKIIIDGKFPENYF
jgi:hypothetical protein